jgi:multidrug resistance efflux pump
MVLVLLALGYWYFSVRPAQVDPDSIAASGTIEITQVQIGVELGGKVIEVRAAEGQRVQAGEILVRLDDSLLQAQRAQAGAALEAAQASSQAALANQSAAEATVDATQASIDAAQASLDLLEAGASAQQIAAAQAQLAQAEANRLAAEASFAALTLDARPEEISAAQMQLDLARQAYYELNVVLTDQQIEALAAASDTAQVNLEQGEGRLAAFKADRDTPVIVLQALEGSVEDARAVAEAAKTALSAARQADLPFYLQLEAALRLRNLGQLNLAQAQARQTQLLREREVPSIGVEAGRAALDDAQRMADKSEAAYYALNASAQGDRLRAAWNNVRLALNALNRLGRSTTTTVETALNQLDASTALSEFASANLDALQSGARSQQISAAQAQVAAAQAQLESAQARAAAAQSQAEATAAQVAMAQAAIGVLDVQIGKLTITAPVDGVVLTRVIQPGEIAIPGSTLLVLGQIDEKTITVYIAEDVYGRLSVGQTASVSVDSFPGMSFFATLVQIADQAEFTPRNVQTVEGRKNTVFAVKLRLDDPDDRLKAGMPADVVFNP